MQESNKVNENDLEASIVLLQTQIFMMEERRDALGPNCDEIIFSMKQTLANLKRECLNTTESSKESSKESFMEPKFDVVDDSPKKLIVERQKQSRDAAWNMVWSDFETSARSTISTCSIRTIRNGRRSTCC